ncbi:MAG: DNA gyrase inhibitor YacG [Kofleriaceae bacterium]
MKRACPLCRRDAIKDGNKFWPLCSERCHLIDLGKWLGEEYRVDGEPDDRAAEAAAAVDADLEERS